MNLNEFGWNEYFEELFQEEKIPGLLPGRIVTGHKHIYRVATARGELFGEVTGKMRYEADGPQDFPAVGDWVGLTVPPNGDQAVIHTVLPRYSKFSRKIAGVETREQVVAANFDTVFLVNSLNHDFNLRRLERYLIMAWESGAVPVVILSKADLCPDVQAKLTEVETVTFGVPVHVISIVQQTGFDSLKSYLTTGRTVAVLGSSGVGKSSLINWLAGTELLVVGAIRESDERGRHTTTHRELLKLPTGGLVIDTPGMRELQLWDGAGGIQETFEDIATLAQNCRFTDCSHRQEPGCAIQAALADGTLARERLESFQKLQKELRFLERKQNHQARIEEKRRVKKINQQLKTAPKKH